MKTIIISVITLCLAFSISSAKSQTAFRKEKAKNVKTMDVRKCDAYKHEKTTDSKPLIKTHTICNNKVRDANISKKNEDRKKMKGSKNRK